MIICWNQAQLYSISKDIVHEGIMFKECQVFGGMKILNHNMCEAQIMSKFMSFNVCMLLCM